MTWMSVGDGVSVASTMNALCLVLGSCLGSLALWWWCDRYAPSMHTSGSGALRVRNTVTFSDADEVAAVARA